MVFDGGGECAEPSGFFGALWHPELGHAGPHECADEAECGGDEEDDAVGFSFFAKNFCEGGDAEAGDDAYDCAEGGGSGEAGGEDGAELFWGDKVFEHGAPGGSGESAAEEEDDHAGDEDGDLG